MRSPQIIKQQRNKPPRYGPIQRIVLLLLLDGPRSVEHLAYDWPTLSAKQACNAIYRMATGRARLVDLAGMEYGTSGRSIRTYKLTERGRSAAEQLLKEDK